MADFFHHRYGVGAFHGVLSITHQLVKELINVGEVEIPGHHQGAVNPVVLADKRVNVFHAVGAVGAVPKVTQQQLTHKRHVFFQELGIVQLLFVKLLEVGIHTVENALNGAVATLPPAVDDFTPGVYAQLDGCDAGTVLPPVALLFHQQV